MARTGDRTGNGQAGDAQGGDTPVPEDQGMTADDARRTDGLGAGDPMPETAGPMSDAPMTIGEQLERTEDAAAASREAAGDPAPTGERMAAHAEEDAPHPGPLPANGEREMATVAEPAVEAAADDAPHPGPLPASGERESTAAAEPSDALIEGQVLLPLTALERERIPIIGRLERAAADAHAAGARQEGACLDALHLHLCELRNAVLTAWHSEHGYGERAGPLIAELRARLEA